MWSEILPNLPLGQYWCTQVNGCILERLHEKIAAISNLIPCLRASYKWTVAVLLFSGLYYTTPTHIIYSLYLLLGSLSFFSYLGLNWIAFWKVFIMTYFYKFCLLFSSNSSLLMTFIFHVEWMNEWSGYLYTAFHQVSDPISKRFTLHTTG